MDRDLLLALRLLQWPNPMLDDRPTYWQIAKYLDLSPKSVRMKLARLADSGVFGGINFVPDVSLFGLSRTAVYVSAERSVQNTIWNDFSTLDTVIYLHRYGLSSDTIIMEVVHYDEEHLKSQLELFSKVFGQINVRGKQVYKTSVDFKFDSKDIAILRVLVTDPMIKLSRISALTGIGVRTINSRIHKMAFSNAISCEPIFNGYNGVQPLFYIVSIFHGGDCKKEIKEKAIEVLKFNYVSIKEYFDGTVLFLVAVENFQDMSNLYEELESTLTGSQLTLIHPFESRYNLPRIVKTMLNNNIT